MTEDNVVSKYPKLSCSHPLNIWGMVEEEITSFKEFAVDTANINLDSTGKYPSYVEIYYYDINSLVYGEEEPKHMKVEIGQALTCKLHREIMDRFGISAFERFHLRLEKEKTHFDAFRDW